MYTTLSIALILALPLSLEADRNKIAYIQPQQAVEIQAPKKLEPVARPRTTEEIIRSYFKDIPVMVEIAKCESRFRQFDEHGKVLEGIYDSDDRGTMQINVRYHPDAIGKIETLVGNLEYARHIFEREGTQPWIASAGCVMRNSGRTL